MYGHRSQRIAIGERFGGGFCPAVGQFGLGKKTEKKKPKNYTKVIYKHRNFDLQRRNYKNLAPKQVTEILICIFDNTRKFLEHKFNYIIK